MMKEKDKPFRGMDIGARRARRAKPGVPAPVDARFQAVFEGSRDAIGVSKAGVHLFVNPAYLQLFGFPAGADLAGKPVLDLIAPESRDRIREYIGSRMRGEPVPATYETRGLCVDGSAFDMEVKVSVYRESGEDHTLVILRDVTERKRDEQEIAERGARLQQIMDTASVAIFLVDKSGRIVHANRRMAEMFDCPPAELVGSEYVEHVHPAERETGRRKMLALLASEIQDVDLERRYWRRDGTEFWGHLAGRRYHDTLGNELGLIGVITDISARKRVEEQVRTVEKAARGIFEALPIGIHMYRLEADGRLVFSGANTAADWILGTDNSVFVGKTIEEAFPPLKSTEVPQRYREAAASGTAWWTEQIDYREGVIQGAFEVHAFQTAPNAMAAAFEDITGRKRSELALQRSEEKYRRLYNETPVLLQSIDRNGVVVEVNDHWLRTLAYERHEVVGRKVTDFYTEASRKYAEEVVQPSFFRGGSAQDVPYQFVKKTGEVVDVLLSATPERDAAGAIVRSQAVIVDVTQRMRVEKELRENQERLDLALQSAHMGVWRWEIKEHRRYFDELTCQLLGIDASTFSGTTEEFFRAVHPEDHEALRAAFAGTLEKDLLYEPAYRAVWPDGSVRHLAARGRLFRDEQGQPLRINGILWDVTDQRTLEQERIKMQKLESVGTLAGGIAHDFNNLLQGVFGFVSMARLTHDQKEKSLALLEQAEKALHRSVNLTAQLLTFSKGGKPVKKVVDLQPVIESAVALALSGSSITPEIVVAPDLSTVEADEGQIGQVIQNIVLNADQAMPLGGTIRITARNQPAAAIVPPAGLQGDFVEISIRDQGTGIPAGHLARIFDPYFTTKEKGSGLGLATSYSIVGNHGGVVRVQSEVGSGTTFRIYLPATGALKAPLDPPAIPAATRKGRVLVMDDEGMIRELAGEMLRSLGHEFEVVEHGHAALEAWRSAREAGRPFDVVILDLTIRGGMGGLETRRKLAEIDPGVKTIVSSGYSEDASLSDYREQGFQAVLDKPYSLAELQRVLSGLLS